VKPPIRQHIATGDIVEQNGNRFLVLSPPCDVAVRCIDNGIPKINATRIILSPLIKVDRSTFIAHKIISQDDNVDRRESALKKVIKGQRDKYIFLPVYKELYASVADLQNLHSVDFDEFIQYERLATVSGLFLKDIQSRFSSYYGRQGQPDMDKNSMIKACKKILSQNS
jgi:hypothetical protein